MLRFTENMIRSPGRSVESVVNSELGRARIESEPDVSTPRGS
jgi:hypothetical protein